jgi:DNA-binding transcriptional LysR family regulator
LQRAGGAVSLTDAGAAFLPEARRTVEVALNAALVAQAVESGELGRVTLACAESALYGVLPELLREFKRRHPRIHVRLRSGSLASITSSLKHGDIQVALLRLPFDHTGLEVRRVRTDRFLAVLPTDHHLARASMIELRMLAQDDFVLFQRESAPGFFDLMIGICQSVGFSPRIVHEVDGFAAMLGVVAGTRAVTLAPWTLSKWSAPAVSFKPLADVNVGSDLVVVWRKGVSEATTTFMVDTVMNSAKSVPQANAPSA